MSSVVFELQVPVALAVTDAAGQVHLHAAFFQIDGVEIHGFQRIQRQGHGAEALTRIVNRDDVHRAGAIRVIDDANQALLDPVGARHDQRQGMSGLRQIGRCKPRLTCSSRQIGQLFARAAFQQAQHLERVVG